MKGIFHNTLRTFRRMLLQQDAAAASEYALILGLVVVAVVAAVTVLGLDLSGTTSGFFGDIAGYDSAPNAFGPGNFRNHTMVNP